MGPVRVNSLCPWLKEGARAWRFKDGMRSRRDSEGHHGEQGAGKPKRKWVEGVAVVIACSLVGGCFEIGQALVAPGRQMDLFFRAQIGEKIGERIYLVTMKDTDGACWRNQVTVDDIIFALKNSHIRSPSNLYERLYQCSNVWERASESMVELLSHQLEPGVFRLDALGKDLKPDNEQMSFQQVQLSVVAKVAAPFTNEGTASFRGSDGQTAFSAATRRDAYFEFIMSRHDTDLGVGGWKLVWIEAEFRALATNIQDQNDKRLLIVLMGWLATRPTAETQN